MVNKKVKKWAIRSAIIGPSLFLLTPVMVGMILTHPFRRRTEETPADYGLEFEEVEFKSKLGQLTLRGWWIPSKSPSNKTVITAHGYTDERSQKKIKGLDLVQSLNENGYNVFMFDFRNSGKSEGRHTGIGYYEKHDLESAVDYVIQEKQQPNIVLLGWSMGAATSLLVGTEHPKVKGVIADSPFHDLNDYLNENLSVWSKLPKKPFTAMILRSIEHLLKIDPNEVSPISTVKNGKETSYLLIHGKNDKKIPYRSSELIFEQIPDINDKSLWITEYDHITSFVEEKEVYKSKVLEFLEKTFILDEKSQNNE